MLHLSACGSGSFLRREHINGQNHVPSLIQGDLHLELRRITEEERLLSEGIKSLLGLRMQIIFARRSY